MAVQKLEVWQRGPVGGVPALLQPVAHALLQAREELTDLLVDFPDALLGKDLQELHRLPFTCNTCLACLTVFLPMPEQKRLALTSWNNCMRKILLHKRG